MNKHNRRRLCAAICAALEQKRQHARRQQARPAGVAPGNLYVLPSALDVAIEWLVVRPHPDDASLVLLVPTDDFPLAGAANIRLQPPRIARCGESVWVPDAVCLDRHCVDFVTAEDLAAVRQRLAALARGNLTDNADAEAVEADVEYREWMSLVAAARAETEVAV